MTPSLTINTNVDTSSDVVLKPMQEKDLVHSLHNVDSK